MSEFYLDSGSRMRGSHSGAFILERCVTDGETATKFFGLANLNIIDSTRNYRKKIENELFLFNLPSSGQIQLT